LIPTTSKSYFTDLETYNKQLLKYTKKEKEKHKKHKCTEKCKELYSKEIIVKKYKLVKPIHPYYKTLSDTPLLFLKPTILIARTLEAYGRTNVQALPMRTSFVPKHTMFDTTGLNRLLVGGSKVSIKKEERNILWNKFFHIDKYETKAPKNFTFGYSIRTDGLTVSIVYKNGKKPVQSKVYGFEEFAYLDQLDKDAKEALQKRTLVGIDPGINDLMKMTDDKGNVVRYSKLQRRSETMSKKAEQTRKKIITKIITDAQQSLTTLRSKSSVYKVREKYIKERQHIEGILYKHYAQEVFRKLRFNVYIGTQKSEAAFVNRVKNTYGEEAVLAVGNWNRRQGFKYHRPTPDNRLRRLLIKNGFSLYLINEYLTSSVCSKCKGKVEKYYEKDNPKPYKENTITVHSLLRCKNVECGKLWNRDVMASKNILEKAKIILKGEEMPKYYKPSKNQGEEAQK
jgi:hypothetical protein